MEKRWQKIGNEATRELFKHWVALAKKNNNLSVDLYDKNRRKLGSIEQGRDGFTEIIIKGPHFEFTKIWLYPPADKDGWIKAGGLVSKK